MTNGGDKIDEVVAPAMAHKAVDAAHGIAAPLLARVEQLREPASPRECERLDNSLDDLHARYEIRQ